ncbi:MAG: hypothetical protein EOP56_04655 [Sphingobacteriales bacterium]|nr:MAG: hypothetical protein EOP56_04655 [Sphingobacteriales bacterium]
MQASNRKLSISIAGFAAILIFFCATYYGEMLHMKPRGIHDWAQADRLSLAVCFYDEGMDFFKPRTHNVYSTDGVTGVEFPIQAYLAAVGGKVFGREHISSCFRLMDTIIACAGLLFLFMAAYKRTDFVFSMVAPLFVFCAPMFIYYACNYVPDAVAVSILFAAFYFVLNYIDERKTRDMLWAIGLMTLATLIKTSDGLYMLGFIGLVTFQRLRHMAGYNRKSHYAFIASALVAVALPVAYYFYNRYLNQTYHSTVFLAKANPFTSWEDFQHYIDVDFKLVWMREYLELPQYLLLVVVLVIALPLLKHTSHGRTNLLLLSVFLIGVLCMGYLMGAQLRYHDYYVLSIFLPLISFALLVSVIVIYEYASIGKGISLWRRGWIAAIIIMFFFADFHHHQRLKPDYYPFGAGIPWAYDGHILMDELHIPKDERIIVLGEDAPNIALVHLDRKGYHIPTEMSGNLQRVVQLMGQLHVSTLVCTIPAANHILKGDDYTRGRFKQLAMTDKIAVLSLLP